MLICQELEALASEFIYESNLIEEINISQENIITQLQNNVNIGHSGALLYIDSLVIDKTSLHKQDICFCQELIIEEQNELGTHKFVGKNGIGRYRALGINVFIGGRMGVSSEKIDKTMQRLLSDIRRFLKEQNTHASRSEQQILYIIKRIANFHYRFEQIHPFVDGNGRTGRLLAWYLFRFLGLTPFVFTDHDKRYTYYHCFDDVKDMEKYFLHRYKM